MTTFRAAIPFALSFLVFACGNSEESSKPDTAETKCRLDVTLSGAIEFQSEPDSFDCASTIEQGTGIMMVFIQRPKVGTLESIGVGAPDIGPEQIGSGFDASLTIEHEDGRSFFANCEIDVEKNTLDHASGSADVYRLEGSGTCDPPPMPSADDVTVGPFSFVGTQAWQ